MFFSILPCLRIGEFEMTSRKEIHVYCTAAAIIERVHDGELEVLLQTRWKPEDTLYSGLLEIPGGRIQLGEDVQSALRREIEEETGLQVEEIAPSVDIRRQGKNSKTSVTFVPFCGEQFLGSNYIGFVFICKASGKLLQKGIYDGKDPRWFKFSELKRILSEKPEEVFPYHLSALTYYVQQREKEWV
jgi:8-oxo-dGTP pyrophosphatase MutT (NUDIX family)